MYHPGRQGRDQPRWINVDDRIVRDTWTRATIRLTCDPLWPQQTCNDHAMQVVDALNRIYGHG